MTHSYSHINDRMLEISVLTLRTKGFYLFYYYSFNEGWNITCRPKYCGVWKLCNPININLYSSKSCRLSSSINYPEHKSGVWKIYDKKLHKDPGAGQILKEKRVEEKIEGIIIQARKDVTKKSGDFDSLGIWNTRGVGLRLFAALISNSNMDDCQ